MTTVPVRIAGELTIHVGDLPPQALDLIKSGLTIANEEREKAAALKQFGWWDLPETEALWREEERRGGDRVLLIPRGASRGLAAVIESAGAKVEWIDQRCKSPAKEGYFKPFLLRDYQFDAVRAMLAAEQGFYKAPAGSGKTITSLGAMAYAGQRTLVIVDKAGLVEQWRARAAMVFGFPTIEHVEEDGTVTVEVPLFEGEGRKKTPIERTVGKIGQDVWEERDLTICLRQTLHSRAWQMKATKWWRDWGMVFFDEGHHLAAETLSEVCRRVESHWMLAVSATPAKSIAKGQKVHAMVGPIIHETPREILYERKILIKPTVEILNGDFFAHYHYDHDAEFDNDEQEWKCQMHGCRKKGKHSHRNNYSSVQKKLVEDEARCQRIVNRIMMERGQIHLVPSRQLKLLNLVKRGLEAAGWPKDKIWSLRGEENAQGLAQPIAQAVEKADEGVILSTVADEGLDIPPISFVHLVFPMRDEGATIQVCGRCERIWPGKEGATIIDYREPLVDVFESQYEARATVYRMQGYDVTTSPHSVLAPGEEAA